MCLLEVAIVLGKISLHTFFYILIVNPILWPLYLINWVCFHKLLILFILFRSKSNRFRKSFWNMPCIREPDQKHLWEQQYRFTCLRGVVRRHLRLSTSWKLDLSDRSSTCTFPLSPIDKLIREAAERSLLEIIEASAISNAHVRLVTGAAI